MAVIRVQTNETMIILFMLQPIFSDLWTLPVPLQLTAVLTRVSLVSRTGATSEPVRPRLLNAAAIGPAVALDESLGFVKGAPDCVVVVVDCGTTGCVGCVGKFLGVVV